MTTHYNKTIVQAGLDCNLISVEKALDYEWAKGSIKHVYFDMFKFPSFPIIRIQETKPGEYGVFVEYYANDKHFEAQRTTTQKIARYLNTFYPDRNQAHKETLINHVRSFIPSDILFTSNGKESVEVYQAGPDSCMSYEDDHFACNQNPCIVYDPTKGDLCVAYIKRGGRITARAVCWRDKKLYGRVYGDIDTFEPAMKKLGFTCCYGDNSYDVNKSFVGAKLPYIPYGDNGGFIFPYFDGISYVSVLSDQKHVVLHDKYRGEDVPQYTLIENHSPDSQTGITPDYCGDEREYCEYCDEYYGDGETNYIETTSFEGSACGHCIDRHFSRCDECGELAHDSDTFHGENHEVYCSSECYRENYEECEECDEAVKSGELMSNEDGDMMICSECKEKEDNELDN